MITKCDIQEISDLRELLTAGRLNFWQLQLLSYCGDENAHKLIDDLELTHFSQLNESLCDFFFFEEDQLAWFAGLDAFKCHKIWIVIAIVISNELSKKRGRLCGQCGLDFRAHWCHADDHKFIHICNDSECVCSPAIDGAVLVGAMRSALERPALETTMECWRLAWVTTVSCSEYPSPGFVDDWGCRLETLCRRNLDLEYELGNIKLAIRRWILQGDAIE